jgi:hypothetical protein
MYARRDRLRGLAAEQVRSAQRTLVRQARLPEDQRPSHSPPGIWRAYKRLTQIGLPRRFVIVQFPNIPLIVAFIAGEIGNQTHGSGHAYASSVSYLALAIWAYLELVEGVNWFRRLLGLAYAISTVVHLALVLQ